MRIDNELMKRPIFRWVLGVLGIIAFIFGLVLFLSGSQLGLLLALLGAMTAIFAWLLPRR